MKYFRKRKMLSFVIIGRNEGRKLTKCLQSVFDTIESNSYLNTEVIYVDSRSSDDSIERAMSFQGVRILKLLKDFNAAIARNSGALESKGDVLFFIDGDMEIKHDFLPLVYDENTGLKYNFVSGQFIDYNYDYSGNLENQALYFSSLEDHTISYTTGGLFLIKREIWNLIGGMRNKLKRNQDIDLGLRLAKRGFLLYRRNEILAVHHTVSYHSMSRTWRMIFSDSELYRAVLLRDNIANKYQWLLLFRENYSAILLAVNIFITLTYNIYFFLVIYIFMILFRGFSKARLTFLSKINVSGYYLFRDILFLFALIFFWPKSKNNVSYEVLNSK